TVDFKNTVVILTSNLGSQYLIEGVDDQGTITPEAQSSVRAELRRAFRPEFLNRLDEIILFKPLMKSEISQILDLMLAELEQRIRDKGITLSVSPEARDFIVDK